MTPSFRSLDDADSLRSLVRNLREAIYITNARGEILDGNPAFFNLLGVRSISDLQNYGANELVVNPARRLTEIEVVEREGFARDFELQLVRPDGTLLTVLDTVYGVLDPETNEVVYHGMLVDITQRKRMEEDLRQQSMRDPLTGCFNRRYLAEMDEELSPSDSPWGCLFIDIDHFKHYNDHYGHLAGDECLRQVARILGLCVKRSGELVARYGGEEFALLLPGTDLQEGKRVAQRCLHEMLNARIPHEHSPVSPWLTCSIGVATIVAAPGLSPATLVGDALAALAHAKVSGRARVEMADPSPVSAPASLPAPL